MRLKNFIPTGADRRPSARSMRSMHSSLRQECEHDIPANALAGEILLFRPQTFPWFHN